MCCVINMSHLPRSTVHFTRTFDSCARNAERCHGVSRILRQFYFYKVKKNLWQAWQGSKIELKTLVLLTNSTAKGGGLQWQGLARLLVLLAFLTIVPIVPDCTKGSWYKFEQITIGI